MTGKKGIHGNEKAIVFISLIDIVGQRNWPLLGSLLSFMKKSEAANFLHSALTLGSLLICLHITEMNLFASLLLNYFDKYLSYRRIVITNICHCTSD